MSAENAELVRKAFEQWNIPSEREALLEVIHPDVEIYVASAQITGGGPFHGHDGYREWIATMEESFEVWRIHPATFEQHGDTVLVLGHMHLRGRGSGVELDQETGWTVEVHDGLMTRFHAFLSHAEARAGVAADVD